MSQSAKTLQQRQRERDWEMLIVSAIVIVLCFLLNVRSDGRVALRPAQSLALPELCLSHSLFGIDCPACGLTRSFIALSRGQWRASLAYNRCGWLLALAVLLQVPYRALSLSSGLPPLGQKLPHLFGYALIAALIINWLA